LINTKSLIMVLASIGLSLILLLITVSNTVPLPAKAGPKADAWDEYPIPQEGRMGDWVLTRGETGVSVICAVVDSRRGDYQNGLTLWPIACIR
jgi:hypothetical protein